MNSEFGMQNQELENRLLDRSIHYFNSLFSISPTGYFDFLALQILIVFKIMLDFFSEMRG